MAARVSVAISVLALVVLAAAQVWLARIEREPPARRWIDLEGGVPATLYLPGDREPFPPPPPRPADERAPAVVLVHGHSGDQVGVSGLARSLAAAGYATLTIDLRGHGRNRNAFNDGSGLPDQFAPELRAAVDYLRRSRFVDGSRIALAGHSMGAGAVLDYATRDSGIDAAVMIAGGWEMAGPHRPPNALFIYAENDLQGIPESSDALASRLAGEPARRGVTYGTHADATAVRVHRVPGASHGNIIRADEAVRKIVAWLDAVWGLERAVPARYEDPRTAPALTALGAFLVVLVGLGGVVGRLAHRAEIPPPESTSRGRFANLLPLAVALAALLPFFSHYSVGFLFNVTEGDRAITYLSVVGIVLIAGLALSGRLDERLAGVRRTSFWVGSLALAIAGILVAYALYAPWAVTLRGLVLTPERVLLTFWIGAALLPFTLAFHLLLLPGESKGRAVLVRVIGRVVVLAALGAGLALQFFFFPTRLVFGVLVVNYATLELVFGGYYTVTRNPVTAAAFEALWLGWMLAVSMPSSL